MPASTPLVVLCKDHFLKWATIYHNYERETIKRRLGELSRAASSPPSLATFTTPTQPHAKPASTKSKSKRKAACKTQPPRAAVRKQPLRRAKQNVVYVYGKALGQAVQSGSYSTLYGSIPYPSSQKAPASSTVKKAHTTAAAAVVAATTPSPPPSAKPPVLPPPREALPFLASVAATLPSSRIPQQPSTSSSPRQYDAEASALVGRLHALGMMQQQQRTTPWANQDDDDDNLLNNASKQVWTGALRKVVDREIHSAAVGMVERFASPCPWRHAELSCAECAAPSIANTRKPMTPPYTSEDSSASVTPQQQQQQQKTPPRSLPAPLAPMDISPKDAEGRAEKELWKGGDWGRRMRSSVISPRTLVFPAPRPRDTTNETEVEKAIRMAREMDHVVFRGSFAFAGEKVRGDTVAVTREKDEEQKVKNEGHRVVWNGLSMGFDACAGEREGKIVLLG